MPRIRTIKPDFWTDEKVVELDPWARLLFIGLWNFADDQGYIEYSPKRIKMQIFPGDTTDVSPLLASLLEAGLLVAFDSPVGRLLHIQSWSKHQRVSNAASPRVDPADLVPINLSDSHPPEPSRALCTEEEGNRREGNRREGKGTSAAKAVSNSLAREGARDEPPPNAGRPGRAEALLTEWRAQQRRPVGSVVAAVGMWIHDAVRDEHTDDDIRETLCRWDGVAKKGPGLLPSILHEVANAPVPSNVLALPNDRASPAKRSTTDQRVAEALAHASRLEAQGGFP